MQRIGWKAAGAAGLALALALPVAAASSPWLHVRVEETGKKATKVAVNLPLSLVDAVLEAAPEKIHSHGRVHIGNGHDHLEVADLRKMWAELKNAGDTDIVSVEQDDETVLVARQGDLVRVDVQKPKGKQNVKIEIPIDVVDALFSGEGEELNLRAALVKLQGRRGDIVRVSEQDGTSVRIWIGDKE